MISTDEDERYNSGLEAGRKALRDLLYEPLVTFAELKSSLVPAAPGIYLVYEDGEPSYAGSTSDLRRRICYDLLPANDDHHLAYHMTKHMFDNNQDRCKAHLKAHCSVRYLKVDS
ncbi:MAG: hypothetical protein QXJ32_07420, partial [Thermoplasmata archaeon]